MSLSDDPLLLCNFIDGERYTLCASKQREIAAAGRQLTLAEVALELGYITAEQAGRCVAHRQTAVLRCPKCRKKFTVPDYQAHRRYKCSPDDAYLEFRLADNTRTPVGSTSNFEDHFIGKVFGKFRLLKRLARGGMGLVYLGEHLEIPRKAAVKILSEEFSKMPGIRARYHREGQTAGRLEHPNIVHVIDMNEHEGLTYIASEFIEGPSLSDVINKEKQPLPVDRSITLACDILSALQHAHDNGVVHRDIKPQNILLTPEGRAKVIDFGLAMDAEAQTILTMAGNVMGSPSYMSPEQARGERGGPESDQYSCGIVLFLMLTHKKPFEGKSLIETLNLQVKAPLPPIRALNPNVSESVELVIRKMTSKNVGDRFKSCAEAARYLRQALKGKVTVRAQAATASPSTPPRRRSWVRVILLLILLAALAGAWYLNRRFGWTWPYNR